MLLSNTDHGRNSGGIHRSRHLGRSWEPATTDGDTAWNRLARFGTEHFSAAVSPVRRGWIYATMCEDAPSFGLYLSKDDGKTFQPLEGLPFDNAMRLTFDLADNSVLYASTFGGSVRRGEAE